MKKELILKKKKILERISLKEYRDLLSFVERIYLAKNPLKILLARKCSNLFLSLIELVKEEDGGRVQRLYEQSFSSVSQPIIISDRALSFYAKEIREGKFEDILIVDDVILHGTTISNLYDELLDFLDNKKCDIKVLAYAANDGNLLDRDYLINAEVIKKVSIDKCRQITDSIIDIFYIVCQPYTSYIPNIKIKNNSKLGNKIKRFVDNSTKYPLTDDNYHYLNVKSYAWVSQENWKCALFHSLRIYINEDLGEYVFVPMVSLLPIKESVLNKYRKILNNYFGEEAISKMLEQNEEWCYRGIIYILSAIWFRQFILEHLDYTDSCQLLEDDLEEEVYFGIRILNKSRLNELTLQDIHLIVECLNESYESLELSELLDLSSDFSRLDDEISRMIQSKTEDDVSLLVQRFLRLNGKIEECNWKENYKNAASKSKRLIGYPISVLPTRIRNTYSTSMLFEQILKAIDFGRGSIIEKMLKKQNEKYFVSILHAGEQNYKYTEFKYFPFIYGLFEIERMAREKKEEEILYKEAFTKQYLESDCMLYIRKKGGYDEEDMKELSRINITSEYKAVLLKDIWHYQDKEALSNSIYLANKIMGNEVF